MTARFPVRPIGFLLAVAVICIGFFCIGHGAEITLFPETIPEVCLFSPDAVSLFPDWDEPETVSLFETRPGRRNIEQAFVQLFPDIASKSFDANGDSAKIEQTCLCVRKPDGTCDCDHPECVCIDGQPRDLCELFAGDFSRNQSSIDTEPRPVKRCLVYVTARWCKPCNEIKRTVFPALEKRGLVIANYRDRKAATIHVLDVDRDKNILTAWKESPQFLPVVYVFEGEKIVRRHEGELVEADFLELLKPAPPKSKPTLRETAAVDR